MKIGHMGGGIGLAAIPQVSGGVSYLVNAFAATAYLLNPTRITSSPMQYTSYDDRASQAV